MPSAWWKCSVIATMRGSSSTPSKWPPPTPLRWCPTPITPTTSKALSTTSSTPARAWSPWAFSVRSLRSGWRRGRSLVAPTLTYPLTTSHSWLSSVSPSAAALLQLSLLCHRPPCLSATGLINFLPQKNCIFLFQPWPSTKLTRFLKEEGVLASLQQSLIILTSLLPPVNDIYEFLSRGFLKSTTLGC